MPRLNKALLPDAQGVATPEGAGGVVVVERALRILDAFSGREPSLTLAQLSQRAQLNKSTALRLVRSLAWAQYLVQTDDGSWRLGPAAGALGARYQNAFDLNDVVMPVLRDLAKASRQSASLFIRERDRRICLFRVEGSDDARTSVRSGTAFPLDRGAPGRVILAFSGVPGEPYESIRREGLCLAAGERATDDASIAAPVFGANWQLLGALSVSGSASRLSEAELRGFSKVLATMARRASRALGASRVHRMHR